MGIQCVSKNVINNDFVGSSRNELVSMCMFRMDFWTMEKQNLHAFNVTPKKIFDINSMAVIAQH